MYRKHTEDVRNWEACRADWEEGQVHTVDDYLWYCPWDEGSMRKIRELLCFLARDALRAENLQDLSWPAWLGVVQLEDGDD